MPGKQNTFTPDHSDLIRMIIDRALLDMYVAMPAKISSYNASTQYADVQIQLYQGFMDGSKKLYPVIPNVPVKHPRAMNGKAFIHMPLQPGDDVTLMFSSRSLDAWKTSGGMTDPNDQRKSHLTDCFALIGGSSIADAFSVSSPKAIELTNGSSKLQVFPDGTFTVKNSGTELITQLVNQAEDLVEALVLTAFGPSPFIDSTIEQFQEIHDNIETLENG